MSVMVDHFLKAKGIKEMLLKTPIVNEANLPHSGTPFALNMRECCKEEWTKLEAKYIEYGVKDFSKKGPDGQYGLRRDLTPQEILELPLWPIIFHSDDEIMWLCKWRRTDLPAFFISKYFPEVEFQYEAWYEDENDADSTVKNGIFTSNK